MLTPCSDYSSELEMKPAGMIGLSGVPLPEIESGLSLSVAPPVDSAPRRFYTLAVTEGCDPRDVRERRLLLQVAAGNDQAFWELWASHRPRLYLICFAQMGRRVEDAEDALSEAMQRAHDRLPREAPRVRNLRAWLGRITVNLCIDLYRRNRRRERVLCTIEKERAPKFGTADFAASSPAADFEASEVRRMVTRAVQSLPRRLRAASQLYFLQASSYEMIATELEITAPNARKRVQEARPLLRKKLREGFPATFYWEPRS